MYRNINSIMGRIVIRFVERPDSDDPEEIIRWFCAVFGFSGDENGVERTIFRHFAEAAYKHEGFTSSELTDDIDMARSTVIYHLNRFIEAGLLVKRGRTYYLRASELSKTIEEIEYDIEREMRRMLDTAREFDKLMETKELTKTRNQRRQKGVVNAGKRPKE
jgi:predicted transcriptional regulator